jgi:hypothetical protein
MVKMAASGMNRTRRVAVTGAATALLLLVFVVIRLIQDLPLLLAYLASSDSLTMALVIIEAAVLAVVLALAIASGLIAWHCWLGKARSRWPGVLVFSLVCGLGLLDAAGGVGLVAVGGWLAILVGGAALVAQTSANQGGSPE